MWVKKCCFKSRELNADADSEDIRATGEQLKDPKGIERLGIKGRLLDPLALTL